MRLFFHKLFHWEYWPFTIVYIPVYFVWAWYAVRSGSIFFFNAANPRIRNGGFFMESKKEIYDLIPEQYYPRTALISSGTRADDVISTMLASDISFPLIAKPDIGLRGSAVKKIDTPAQLISYSDKANFDYVIQNLIPFRNEIGVFYVRYPGEALGRITGIVAKEFLTVIGDGRSDINQLLHQDPRFELQLVALKKEYGAKLYDIPAEGEMINLVPYGNHARGAKFIDASSWITQDLNDVINQMCLQIEGFYFGRIDLMYDNLADLYQGKNFSVVEINGAGSEPTHIYDPKHSIFFAWKELIRHVSYMYEISVLNHKHGTPYLAYRMGMEQFKLHNLHNKKICSF